MSSTDPIFHLNCTHFKIAFQTSCTVMYPDENYRMKEDKLKLVKKFVRLSSFSGLNQYFWFPYIFFNLAVIVGQLTYLFQVWGDLTKMMGMIVTFVIEFQAIYKLVLLYWKSRQINEMHRSIDEDFWNFDVMNGKFQNSLDRRMILVVRVLSVHLFNGILGAVLYMSFPVSEYPPGIRELPIQSWFPFDTNPSPLHEFVYFLLASNGVVCVICLGLYDFTFIYFAQHLLAQFSLLKCGLENLTKDVIGMDDVLRKVHSEEFQNEIYRRMSVCINHHNILLSFGRELESFSSVGIAMQLFFSMMTFVVIGFILGTDSEDLVKSAKLAFYFGCISLQLAIFAVHGSELQHESVAVASSAYFCEWYLGRGSLRKGLAFLQMNAQKEIKISACGCIDLNNNTFLAVYRSAFSCVTLLRSIDQQG